MVFVTQFSIWSLWFFLFEIFDRLSTEVLSLVPSVSEVTSLFYEPDYPSDFTRTLPPLVEADDTEPSSAQILVDHTKGILKYDNESRING